MKVFLSLNVSRTRDNTFTNSGSVHRYVVGMATVCICVWKEINVPNKAESSKKGNIKCQYTKQIDFSQ